MVVSMKQRLTIIHYNIALWKCAFWLANTLDTFARGLHAHISLFICTFLTFQGTRLSRFRPGQQMTKRKEKNVLPQNKNKPRSKYRSVVSRSTRFRKWRIPRWRIIRACSWNLLSCNIAFFFFLCSNYYFFLTDCWYIRRWSRSCSAFKSVSWQQNELVSNALQQSLSVSKMLSSWKVAGESMTYEDYDTLVVY